MNVIQILSKRKWNKEFAYDLVYEWEDVLSQEWNLPIVDEKHFLQNRYIKLIPFVSSILQTSNKSIVFEMECIASHWFSNRKKNIIPYIIDYYPQEVGMYGYKMFNMLYKVNPIVFISSAEVYEHLLSHNKKIDVNIAHVALSLPDKYRLDANDKFKKEYDLVLFGRQNPVLMDFLATYVENHPDFKYVYRGKNWCYYTSDNLLVGEVNTRDKYMNLMKKARCAFYSTPGIDGEKETFGFNQITPRFLELLSCGCHIIARYADNPDAQYFEIGKFCKSVETYQQFEEKLDYARCHDVNIKNYSAYLEKHYTSVRAREIKEILKSV